MYMMIDSTPKAITIKSRLENFRIALPLLKYFISTINAHIGIANKKIVIIISPIVTTIAGFVLIYKAI
jgi:hypothetical protein